MKKINLKEKKLIIFDLDGTLIDSLPDLSSAINILLQEKGFQTFEAEEVKNWVGEGMSKLIERALQNAKAPQEELTPKKLYENLKRYKEIYHKNPVENTYVYPGVIELLEALEKENKKLCIITNKASEFIEPILIKLELKKYFHAYLGGDSLPQKKPNPEPLDYLIKQFNCTREETLMIGDSKNDILAAQNAHVESIAIKGGYNYGEAVELYNPDMVVNNMVELQKLL